MNNNIKILLISNMYPTKEQPVFGVFVKNFEDGVLENGGIIYKSVISGKGKTKLQKIFKYLGFFFSVYKNLLLKDFDLVYVHYSTHSVLPLVPVYKFITKPIIINAHGGDLLPQNKMSEVLFKITRNCVHNCKMMVVPSRYFCEIAKKKYNHNNVFVSASGGINTELFKPVEILKDQMVFTLGYVSRIDEGKGWDTVLDALFNLVLQKITNVRLLMIGGGVQQSQLIDKISSLGLKDYVTYLGSIPQKELPLYYTQMDVFVFPTRLPEGLGLVGLEAMACGVPVIGSDIGGLKDYIKSGYNGELFELGNSQALCEIIKRFMILDIKEREQYQNNAIITARQYDSQAVGQKLYNRLLELIL